MKKSELIRLIQENCIDDDDDFDVKAHISQRDEGTVLDIDLVFFNEGTLYLGLTDNQS